jgi:hypothetical protein
MTNPLDKPPEGEPSTLVAGDTWIWRRSDLTSDYPVALYVLSYNLKAAGDAVAAPVVFTASIVANTYQVLVAPAVTLPLVAGEWQWAGFMKRIADNARVQIGYGRLTVLADRASATADPRSFAQKMVAAIESVIQNRAVSDVNSYSIAGRSLTKMTPSELMEQRDYWRKEVINEQINERARQGKSTGRIQAIRFSR